MGQCRTILLSQGDFAVLLVCSSCFFPGVCGAHCHAVFSACGAHKQQWRTEKSNSYILIRLIHVTKAISGGFRVGLANTYRELAQSFWKQFWTFCFFCCGLNSLSQIGIRLKESDLLGFQSCLPAATIKNSAQTKQMNSAFFKLWSS